MRFPLHLLCVVLACVPFAAVAATRVDADLAAAFDSDPLSLEPVVITYDEPVGTDEVLALTSLGVAGGIVLQELPMVLARINAAQFDALRTREDVVSLYAMKTYRPYSNASRAFIGVDAMMADRELSAANGGMPFSGQGVGVAHVDTGIDATHPDLKLGQSVVQNVYFPFGELQTGATGISINLPSEFVPPVALEDQPQTDLEGGHGTFGAGIVAGSGAASGNFYGGVAPGAKLIGLMAGNDLGLTSFSILQAYDYALANQYRYNIRVANNSFGADLGDPSNYDPHDPIILGMKELHDRFIAVVVAAGNSGDVPGAINVLSVAPWVISVAAGDKQGRGTPAGFSSRGEDDGTGTDVAGQPADIDAPPNLRPDITAPGNDIKSARSSGAGVTNTAGTALGNDINTIPPAFLPYYTTSQGTSFAAPHVSGVIALMLEANPALSPDEIVTLLRETATPMPGYTERTVGAGFVDAHNAVRAALGLTAVSHPADLVHVPGVFLDPEADNSGTTAHDLLDGALSYDATTNEFVYALRVRDMAPAESNHRWTMEFGIAGSTVYASAERTPLGDEFEWGTIEVDPATGVNNQTNRGATDAGEIDGNSIRMRLDAARVAAALGTDIIGMTAGGVNATSWTLIGSFATGGLLLAADTAGAAPFVVDDGNDGGDSGSSDDGTEPAACNGKLRERLPGVLAAGSAETLVPVRVRCGELAAQLTWHPGKEDVSFELIDADGRVIARDAANGRKLAAGNLAAGDYAFRVHGAVTDNVDFVVRSTQQ